MASFLNPLRPCGVQVDVSLSRPSLNDNRSPELRLREYLAKYVGNSPLFIPISSLKRLSELTFNGCYELSVILTIYRDLTENSVDCAVKVADIAERGKMKGPYGLAVDLGSTTIVFYLMDMTDGKTVSRLSIENPQRSYGEDILSRILHASSEDGLMELYGLTIDAFNAAIDKLCKNSEIEKVAIHFVTVAGNTTMTHFFLGLDPSHLCKEPYIPVANYFDLIGAREIGLNIHPEAMVFCFPNVGSYFGGDLLAGIIACGMNEVDDTCMLIDVGTNAEVVLGNSSWMVACAGAAGPALEGGILTCGMRAEDGAIERVRVKRDAKSRSISVSYSTINNAAPKGICGSGIIDLIAELFLAGLVDPTGRLQEDRRYITEIDGEPSFIVAFSDETAHGRPIYITQSDIKNLIRSKGAMFTILNVVIESVGIQFDDISRYYIAGAFGNYIDPKKAITIGMLPDISLDRFVGIGNAAGKGAQKLLLNANLIRECKRLIKTITYLEMNVRGDFMSKLTGALFLPHTDRSRFPSVWKKIPKT